jgi:hypothetical protein
MNQKTSQIVDTKYFLEESLENITYVYKYSEIINPTTITEPSVLSRAKSLKDILDNKNVFLEDDIITSQVNERFVLSDSSQICNI